MCDITVDYFIHLRFADGSVNSVIPDSTAIDETGTKLVWKVRKNDIFMHGYFELQLEGRGENGYVFQTQIVTLYADESIPIEDKEYLNPNSETLKLREETQKLLDETKLCRTEIDKTKKLIEQSDITKKEDNSNKVSDSSQITDYTQNYPSIKYLTDNYWDSADSYSSDEVDILLNAKADNKTLNERLTRMDMSIGSKYDSSNIELGTATLTPYSTQIDKIKSATCRYRYCKCHRHYERNIFRRDICNIFAQYAVFKQIGCDCSRYRHKQKRRYVQRKCNQIGLVEVYSAQ